MRWFVLTGSLVLAGQVMAETLPQSGFHDMIAEPPTYRMRYVIKGLGGPGKGFADLSDHMAHLCQDALPYLRESGHVPERVVITLMSRPVTYGVADPGAVQFFESYLIENDLCIWEAF